MRNRGKSVKVRNTLPGVDSEVDGLARLEQEKTTKTEAISSKTKKKKKGKGFAH